MKDDFEIVLTSSSQKIRVVVTGPYSKTEEDYRNLFLAIAKTYSAELDDEILNNYWEQLLQDDMHSLDFDEFSVLLRVFNNRVEMIDINGVVTRASS